MKNLLCGFFWLAWFLALLAGCGTVGNILRPGKAECEKFAEVYAFWSSPSGIGALKQMALDVPQWGGIIAVLLEQVEIEAGEANALCKDFNADSVPAGSSAIAKALGFLQRKQETAIYRRNTKPLALDESSYSEEPNTKAATDKLSAIVEQARNLAK